MASVHESIAIGLATEFRAFCINMTPGVNDDWFKWEWSNKVVYAKLEDGMISVFDCDPMVKVRVLEEAILIVECDLAHPDLVEILREKLVI